MSATDFKAIKAPTRPDERPENETEKGLPLAHAVTRGEQINALPGIAGAWTSSRDIPALPSKSFRQLWAEEEGEK